MDRVHPAIAYIKKIEEKHKDSELPPNPPDPRAVLALCSFLSSMTVDLTEEYMVISEYMINQVFESMGADIRAVLSSDKTEMSLGILQETIQLHHETPEASDNAEAQN